MKKLNDKINPKNELVHVVLSLNNEEYECVGVLTEDNNDSIEVAFNAVNKKIVDDLIFKKPTYLVLIF